ncbi:TetR/AcrR family transcriptional regulator [Amycolatopsis alkalitolerans]|uniref:TetR/AcrR family transcriptional regulator n=1 Tax=Amycolatopsis alkalitolerans TaxID=2547244 RepID=A0A5C4M830_9PSEU|nr:TetR/AcrR family transcriptional regulator [Amycolatopsis alkalitolerans]TNC29627.1 TetR/AcrR family transcriptional regulator [Amycolatopsis alkalitolerans]
MKTLTPAAQRVLDVAAELFYAKGIHAVGVDTIAAEAGVTKKTLYDRFGSKDELVGQYLAQRDERWRAHVREVVARSPRTSAVRRPLLVFDALEEWMAHETARGCGFVNAHAELPERDHPGRRVIQAQKEWQLAYFRELVAGLRNPARLAESLFILLEGATVAESLQVVPGAVANAKRLARQLLEAAA